MQDFARCFVRNGRDAWLCVASGEFAFPEGRVQVAPGLILAKGTKFMGVDLVALLEAEEARQQPPAAREQENTTREGY